MSFNLNLNSFYIFIEMQLFEYEATSELPK